MAETNPSLQLEYNALLITLRYIIALRYAKEGKKPEMDRELKLAKHYSLRLGIQLDPSVEECIRGVYNVEEFLSTLPRKTYFNPERRFPRR